ncbi:nitroreductase family deazaflavin-dependent oxidoreductase [Cellulomonas septica]|uniref:Nitroreductase family deazaflavin-dependent oxidoreductase n=1 Tax=Cellulomonas septica TaxID=285080 RepID=A0ABX1K4P5_9CELL|nr:nitroreductase family deazaflavin-dependent oxidoreductase [Cellulomonas septica]NKY40535.1 nitroreductase family deazaflavin-dependent oxidoreductase [Cellulomonas septica]
MTTDGRTGRRRGWLRRAVDGVVTTMVRRGTGPRATVLLTVAGRTSGEPRTTPVTLVEHDGSRWLVAPYGPVGWVRNVRASRVVELRRGRHVERLVADEVDPTTGAPVLRRYLQEVAVVRRVLDVSPGDPVEAFVPLVATHPVFRLRPA